VLIDFAVGLRFACRFFVSLRFGTAMEKAVGSRLPLIALACDVLACFSKIDDVTHAVLLDGTRYSVVRLD
jgi:hypothetical protein